MAMDPDIINAQEVLKRLVLRVNGTTVPYNNATKAFDLTTAGASTETALALQLDPDADLLFNVTSGGTNGHSPTLSFVKGGSNTRLGVDGTGALAWISQPNETALVISLNGQAERLLSVTSAGTNGHSPTINLTPGTVGQFFGVKADGNVGWINAGTQYNFSDTTKRSFTYSGGTGPSYTAQTTTATFTNPSATQTLALTCIHQLEYAVNHNATSVRAAASMGMEISTNGGTFATLTTLNYDDFHDFFEAWNGTIVGTTQHTLAPSTAVTFAGRVVGRFPTANALGKTIPQPASGSTIDMESFRIHGIGVYV